MRVYVPVTARAVTDLAEGRTVAAGPAGTTAFAVTPGLRAWYSEDLAPGAPPPDEEDLEYAACAEAARACLRLLAADHAVARRRVVLAADLPDADVDVRDDLDRGVVRLRADLDPAGLAAVFADDAEAAAAVARAADVVDDADLGDPAAEETVGDTEGFELSWYGPGELGVVAHELAEADRD